MSWTRKALLSVCRFPVKALVRAHCVPADVESELGIDKTKPIVYLLPADSVTDQLSLQMACQQLGLPDPTKTITVAGRTYPATLFLRKSQPLIFKNNTNTGIEDTFADLFHIHREHEELDLQIVPVFITWGRNAGRGESGFASLMTDKAAPSWLRKLFIVTFLGRDNLVGFSKAVSSRSMANQHGSDKKIAHKLVRVASTHFHRKRQSITGPTLLERQELYNSLLASPAVKAAIQDEAKNKKLSSDKAKQRAIGYIDEIAADYREGLIRWGERLLTKLWNKIYNGISVGHADRIRELAQNGHEIVYVPCHRSHMDYLLLTYVIYREGLVTPHIAAGINLNFWPVGKIFRQGGAFFLRRSFAGNKLYTAIFREYLELLFNKGYSVKYYPEGGRSRTGRLIPPKTGMLAMTLQAIVKGVNRPVSIVPVYIGYEHVMEVKSYLKELKGKSKQKESPAQIFSAIKQLKNYGHGFVNFGEPIHVNQFLEKQVPDWRESVADDADKKPAWLTPTVNELANNVMLRINRASAINGMNLTALCLLSSKRMTLGEAELKHAMQDYLSLLNNVSYSADSTLPTESVEDILEGTLAQGRLTVSEDEYGRLISAHGKGAVYLTYYRNNILHMFALPSLIMSIVFSHGGARAEDVFKLVAALYPLLQRELFMYKTQDEALAYAAALIDAFKAQGMLEEKDGKLVPPNAQSQSFHSAWLLSRSIQDTLQRYAVVLSVINAERVLSRSQLEKTSRKLAERMSKLYGVNSPEYYDKNVLSTFISALKDNHWLDTTDDGSLKTSEECQALLNDVIPLVSPEIAQHLSAYHG